MHRRERSGFTSCKAKHLANDNSVNAGKPASGCKPSATSESTCSAQDEAFVDVTSAGKADHVDEDAQSQHAEEEDPDDDSGHHTLVAFRMLGRVFKALVSARAGGPHNTFSLALPEGHAVNAHFRRCLSNLLRRGTIDILPMMFILSNIRCATAASFHTLAAEYNQKTVPPSPADRIQSGFDLFWQTLFPILPYLIFVLGLIWVACIARSASRAPGRRAYSWTLSTIVAIVWPAVRFREKTDTTESVILTTTEATILMTFLAFWSGFMADTQRLMDHKALYLVLSVFAGGFGGVLIAALTFIKEPRTASVNAVIEFEFRASNIIPVVLSVMTGGIYLLLSHREDQVSTDDEEAQSSADRLEFQSSSSSSVAPNSGTASTTQRTSVAPQATG